MSMNFGKLNRAVAFNPTSAFPLDARSYFESYDAAVAAALAAVEAGSTDGTYYFGQTVVVVENQVAKLYLIQPDHSLAPVTGSGGSTQIEVDSNQFEFVNGKLTIKGFGEAKENQIPSVDANGNLIWVDPIDAYTKIETDNKIKEAVANAAHLKRKIVNTVEEIDLNAEDAEQYIYMVPNGLTENDDKYDEYMVVTVADVRFVEKVGSWAVDLSDYAKKTDLDNKVDKVEGSRLITEVEVAKLADVEKNVINGASDEFTISEDRILSLAAIDPSKVTGLSEALNQKVDKKDGWTLVSPTDQKKLESLILDEKDNVSFSGTIEAANVTNLNTLIEQQRDTISGLFSTKDEEKLSGIQEGAEVNFIKSVDTTQFNVDDAGKLTLIAAPVSSLFDKVSDDFSIETAEDNSKTLKLSKSFVESSVYRAEVGDLSQLINTTGNETTTLVEEINLLNDRLAWHEI